MPSWSTLHGARRLPPECSVTQPLTVFPFRPASDANFLGNDSSSSMRIRGEDFPG